MISDDFIRKIVQPTEEEKNNWETLEKLYNNRKSTRLYDITIYNLSDEIFSILMKHRYELLDYLSEKYPEDFLI